MNVFKYAYEKKKKESEFSLLVSTSGMALFSDNVKFDNGDNTYKYWSGRCIPLQLHAREKWYTEGRIVRVSLFAFVFQIIVKMYTVTKKSITPHSWR